MCTLAAGLATLKDFHDFLIQKCELGNSTPLLAVTGDATPALPAFLNLVERQIALHACMVGAAPRAIRQQRAPQTPSRDGG
jgi:hypothetical protein